jgi:hypothetical protein
MRGRDRGLWGSFQDRRVGHRRGLFRDHDLQTIEIVLDWNCSTVCGQLIVSKNISTRTHEGFKVNCFNDDDPVWNGGRSTLPLDWDDAARCLVGN